VGFFVGIFMLTQRRLKELFFYDQDTGLFTRIKSVKGNAAGALSNCKNVKGYVQIMIDYKNYTAHRLAWLYINGRWPHEQIDHINRLKDDNRIANLKEVNNSENQLNIDVRKHNTSGFTGVVKNSKTNKWVAQIIRNKKRYYLGSYNFAHDAAEAVAKKDAELKMLKL
jgi:hypothetical protein